MGVYYGVCCKDCEVCLSFGKKIAKGDKLFLQGILSEREGGWIDGERAWLALQAFLQKHEGHALVFESDAKFPEMLYFDRDLLEDLLD